MSVNSTTTPYQRSFSTFLDLLENHFTHQHTLIEDWLSQQWLKTPPSIYASVDLRNAGFKLAPIDTNLFPAGFNNLKSECLSRAVQAMQITLKRLVPTCKQILLIPESHTRNHFYLENLVVLQTILIQAGFTVQIGSLLETLEAKQELVLASGTCLTLGRIQRVDNRIGVSDFWPDLILLNNDLSSGIPPLLTTIDQPVLPALTLGWSQRLKSNHFHQYDRVCEEFSELLNIDSWLIKPLFRRCQPVDFRQRLGEDCLVEQSCRLFDAIADKYRHYGIKQKPYVIIKADAGTYGMGVISIDDPAVIRRLNRKQRKSMVSTKGNRPIHQVILQEGIATYESWNDAVAESVVYMIGPYVIGGFYRVHSEQGLRDNLNVPGMWFEPWPLVEDHRFLKDHLPVDANNHQFYVHGVIARLALLAAARERQ